MASPSWNEIEERAVLFARDFSSAAREQADKQTFWNEFFAIFGISRRLVATFEEPVKGLKSTYKFIDLLWKGKILIEHKSAGEDLDDAAKQAFDYVQDLENVRRGNEAPRYVLVSDFQRFVLYDLEPDEQLDLPLFRTRRFERTEFVLADLPRFVRKFAFIPNYQLPTHRPQDPLNLKAVEIMASVHDTLKSGGYTGHDLGQFLVRVLFCLFAEDTRIFEPESFRLYIENRTNPDGSDLGTRLDDLFRTLNTDFDKRQRNIDAELKAFPYVNGALFQEKLEFAAFTGPMRKALLEACNFNWSRISPAIFGALFQEVMNDKERRKIGAHYTSERDILKVIHPLFLDGLRSEFAAIEQDRSGRRANRLEDFRVRLTRLQFLDPACGCGNFLVIAYRELRLLELDVLKAQHAGQQTFTAVEVNRLSEVDVDQFYGIEIEEWPARIAEVALWLMDHQSNLQILAAFSQPFYRLPLKKKPNILIANALRMDWNDLLPAAECSYILGNPPFVGKAFMSDSQKLDIGYVLEGFGGVAGGGVLDFVTAWYFMAGQYIVGTQVEVGFVSTNSISQGEQPGLLWSQLFQRGLSINFAYQTFDWMSEARGKAHVHVVIIGFAYFNREAKKIYIASPGQQTPLETIASNISPYLIEGSNKCIVKRSTPMSDAPAISFGNMANDGGHLLLSAEERSELIRLDPNAKELIQRFIGADDLISDSHRYCLWLVNAKPNQLASSMIKTRIAAVRHYRLQSKRKATRQLASTPTLFGEIRQPKTQYIAIPKTSSQTRPYIPLRILPPTVIAATEALCIENFSNYHFGIITSRMHMSWVRLVAGRLKSDYRYSITLVYNNFPWPPLPGPSYIKKVEDCVTAIMAARDIFVGANLGELYDITLMPAELIKAHQQLDRAVERCYRPEPFTSDRERVEFLFALYEQLASPLLPAPAKPRRRRTA